MVDIWELWLFVIGIYAVFALLLIFLIGDWLKSGSGKR